MICRTFRVCPESTFGRKLIFSITEEVGVLSCSLLTPIRFFFLLSRNLMQITKIRFCRKLLHLIACSTARSVLVLLNMNWLCGCACVTLSQILTLTLVLSVAGTANPKKIKKGLSHFSNFNEPNGRRSHASSACACCTQSTPLSPWRLQIITYQRHQMHTSHVGQTSMHATIKTAALFFCYGLRMKTSSAIHQLKEWLLYQDHTLLFHLFTFTFFFLLWSETELNEHIHKEW